MTAKAAGFILAAVALFFLAGATHVGWVRIVDALIWGMLGFSLLLQFLSVAHVHAELRLLGVQHSGSSPGPMEDDTIDIGLDLHNSWFYTRFFLSVSYDSVFESPESRWQQFFVATLGGHGTVNLASRVGCYRRGLHQLGPVIIESRAPFGLFRRRKHIEAPLSILVYPRAYPMNGSALLDGAYGEAERPRRSRFGQETIGSRHYYPGDSIRSVHWRNTARLGKLAVKEFEDPSDRSLTIVFSSGDNAGEGRETALEYSIRLAASVGLSVMNTGQTVRLLAGDRQGDWADAEGFLRELALVESRDSPSQADLLESVPSSSPVIAIVSATNTDGATALRQNLPRLPGMAVIVVEGFARPDQEVVPTREWQSLGLSTVACKRGHLPEAISALESLGGATDAAKDRMQPVRSGRGAPPAV